MSEFGFLQVYPDLVGLLFHFVCSVSLIYRFKFIICSYQRNLNFFFKLFYLNIIFTWWFFGLSDWIFALFSLFKVDLAILNFNFYNWIKRSHLFYHNLKKILSINTIFSHFLLYCYQWIIIHNQPLSFISPFKFFTLYTCMVSVSWVFLIWILVCYVFCFIQKFVIFSHLFLSITSYFFLGVLNFLNSSILICNHLKIKNVLLNICYFFILTVPNIQFYK